MNEPVNLGNPTLLYLQIEKAIKEKILKGELRPGDQLNSHHKLAEEFNVSVITIKKAVTDLVTEGILFTRVGLGTYVAEKSAKTSKFQDHKTIGLVLRDLQHPYFSMIVKSVEERAFETGYTILLSSSSDNLEKEENQINNFIKLGVDGLIIASLSYEYRATEYIQKLHNLNFPYVMVSYIHDPDYWYVGSDHEHGGYIAAEHLIKQNRKSIGYVHAEKGNLLSEVRKNGYYRALLEYNVNYDPDLVFYLSTEQYGSGKDRFQLGFTFGKNFRNLKKKPDALVFYNDIVALGFLQAAIEEKISVPEDVAIVGYDDAQVARYAAVPLTTIHQPVEKIGSLVVDIIEKRINNIGIGNRTILKPTLIVRDSCGARKNSAD